jgi:hypothetical protein
MEDAESSQIKALRWISSTLSDQPSFRSKALKVAQYSAKFVLWAHARDILDGSSALVPGVTVQTSVTSIASTLGTARKLMAFGDCLGSFVELRDRTHALWAEPGSPERARALASALASFLCDITTDWLLIGSVTRTSKVRLGLRSRWKVGADVARRASPSG